MATLEYGGSVPPGLSAEGLPSPAGADRCGAVTSLIQHILPGQRVLDVGAAGGWSTVQLAEAVGPEGHVWAIEPEAEARRDLQQHIMVAGLEGRVTVLPVALGASAGEAEWAAGHSHLSLRAAGPARQGAVEPAVPMQTLDALVASGLMPCPDAIHLDLTGDEASVLTGAQDVLIHGRPALALGWSEPGSIRVGGSLEGLLRVLNHYGYAPVTADGRRAIHGEDELLASCVGPERSGGMLAFPLEAMRRHSA